MDIKHNGENRSQVTLAALAAGFGIARLITTPLRRLYEKRYKERHGLPRVLFVFDALLVCIVITLCIFIVWIIAMPATPITVQANFQSAVFRAGGSSPSTLLIQSHSQTIQRNVRVQWFLPPGVVVYQASPAMAKDGTVFLGDLLPGQTVESHAVLQTLRQEGSETPLQFSITVGNNLVNTRTFTASVARKIEGSALRADIPLEFHADRISATDAYLPLRIENTSDRELPIVEVRPTEDAKIHFDPISLGTIQSGGVTYAYLPIGSVSGTAHLAWTVAVASRDLIAGSFDAQATNESFATIEDGLVANSDGSATVHVEHGKDQHLLSLRPFLAQSVLDKMITDDDVLIDLPSGSVTSSQQRWLVAPMIVDASGTRSLGPATFGVASRSIPFTASILYRNAAGDQLGAGPQPPVVGEETRYWVFWHVGPFDADARSIHVHAALPQGVRATGAVTSPDGGSWSFNDQAADWRLNPSLNAGTNDLTFGFEIAIRPTAEVSSTQPLLEESVLSGIDAASEAKLSSAEGPKTVGDVQGE